MGKSKVVRNVHTKHGYAEYYYDYDDCIYVANLSEGDYSSIQTHGKSVHDTIDELEKAVDCAMGSYITIEETLSHEEVWEELEKFNIDDAVVYKSNPEKGIFYIESILREDHDDTLYTLKDTDGKKCWGNYIMKADDIPKIASPKKFDTGKPRTDLIRPEFILALGEVLGYGADKYSEPIGETPNYLKGEGFQYSRIIGSLERHIQEWKMGVNIDKESNKHHLAHAAANIMFLLTYELTEKGIDDRVVLTKDGDEAKKVTS